MSSFDARWLSLREPADHAARNPGLLAAATAVVKPGGLLVDLGCGTGSTLRAMRPALPAGVRWRLVDNDPELLALAATRYPWAETLAADLSAVEAIPLVGASLVTASALLDLVSADWIERLAGRLGSAGLYAVLNYAGTMSWAEPHPLDAEVVAAFNHHQTGDKGFGPAVGPEAVPVARALFEQRGWRVKTAESPWKLGPEHASMERELIAGVADAAFRAGCRTTRGWERARTAAAGGGCTVGHFDLLALPGQGDPR